MLVSSRKSGVPDVRVDVSALARVEIGCVRCSAGAEQVWTHGVIALRRRSRDLCENDHSRPPCGDELTADTRRVEAGGQRFALLKPAFCARARNLARRTRRDLLHLRAGRRDTTP